MLHAPPTPFVRRLLRMESDAWCQHLLRLDRKSRAQRFGGAVNDATIMRYCRSIDPDKTHIFGAFDGGDLFAVGECVIIDDEHTGRFAELAFSVEQGWQNRGVGTELFRRLIDHARNRFCDTVYITTENDNARMRRIARKFGMSLTQDADGTQGRLRLERPDVFSVASEWSDSFFDCLNTAGTLRPGA